MTDVSNLFVPSAAPDIRLMLVNLYNSKHTQEEL